MAFGLGNGESLLGKQSAVIKRLDKDFKQFISDFIIIKDKLIANSIYFEDLSEALPPFLDDFTIFQQHLVEYIETLESEKEALKTKVAELELLSENVFHLNADISTGLNERRKIMERVVCLEGLMEPKKKKGSPDFKFQSQENQFRFQEELDQMKEEIAKVKEEVKVQQWTVIESPKRDDAILDDLKNTLEFLMEKSPLLKTPQRNGGNKRPMFRSRKGTNDSGFSDSIETSYKNTLSKDLKDTQYSEELHDIPEIEDTRGNFSDAINNPPLSSELFSPITPPTSTPDNCSIMSSQQLSSSCRCEQKLNWVLSTLHSFISQKLEQ